MRTHPHPALPDPDLASCDGLAAGQILALCESLADTLRTAEALVTARRRVDLRGLELQIRDLCARIVALPSDRAAGLLPRLQDLMARIDSLLGALAANVAAEP